MQLYTDIENYSNNLIAYIYDTNFEIKNNDYIKITGIVGDAFVGENMMGAGLVVPTLSARNYEVLT